MPLLAAFASQLPGLVGAIAAGMAIGAFLAQARPAMREAGEQELRRNAAIGGILGLGGGLFVVFLSVTVPI